MAWISEVLGWGGDYSYLKDIVLYNRYCYCRRSLGGLRRFGMGRRLFISPVWWIVSLIFVSSVFTSSVSTQRLTPPHTSTSTSTPHPVSPIFPQDPHLHCGGLYHRYFYGRYSHHRSVPLATSTSTSTSTSTPQPLSLIFLQNTHAEVMEAIGGNVGGLWEASAAGCCRGWMRTKRVQRMRADGDFGPLRTYWMGLLDGGAVDGG